jgi:hypothetical protein
MCVCEHVYKLTYVTNIYIYIYTQIFEEERDKQRKALETEAKKIRGEIQALLDAFDARLAAFADEKLQVDAEIYQLQLQVCV